MKYFVSALNFLSGLLIITILAGCGGVSKTSSTAAPTPTPIAPNPGPPTPSPTPTGTASPTPTPSAASATFVFASSSSLPVQAMTTYRLNSDGILTLATNSSSVTVQSISGEFAASGNFLITPDDNGIVVSRIDPATGRLSFVGSTGISEVVAIAADSRNVYVAGVIPSGGTGIYGFSISASGALTPLVGSPYFLADSCETCISPFTLSLNDNFVIEGGFAFHGVGNFAVYPRNTNGVLGQAQFSGADQVWRVLPSSTQPAGLLSR